VYRQVRVKLPLQVYRAVLHALIKALAPEMHSAGFWRGRHHTFLFDGSSFSMLDIPELQKHFGQPRNQNRGCGFPGDRILAMFHAGTGFSAGGIDPGAAKPRDGWCYTSCDHK
jgi:hypothetical protein